MAGNRWLYPESTMPGIKAAPRSGAGEVATPPSPGLCRRGQHSDCGLLPAHAVRHGCRRRINHRFLPVESQLRRQFMALTDCWPIGRVMASNVLLFVMLSHRSTMRMLSVHQQIVTHNQQIFSSWRVEQSCEGGDWITGILLRSQYKLETHEQLASSSRVQPESDLYYCRAGPVGEILIPGHGSSLV